jgi:hypothetical protein
MKLLVLLLVALPATAQTPGVEVKPPITLTDAEFERIVDMINDLGEKNRKLKERLDHCVSTRSS